MWALFLATFTAVAAEADECPDVALDPPVCDVSGVEMSPTEYLRAVSLDLRGVVPTPEEYATAIADGEVADATIDAWLDSHEFAVRTAERLKVLWWPNVSHRGWYGTRIDLKTSGTPRYIYGTLCADRAADPADETDTDGWLPVHPYWDETATVSACVNAVTTCGPQLEACAPYNVPTGQTARLAGMPDRPVDERSVGWWEAITRQAVEEEVNQRVYAILREDRPFTDLLNGRTMYVNGPLAQFFKYQIANNAWFGAGVKGRSPVDASTLPELAATDWNTWVPVELGAEHSGLLTSPAYLLRFSANRSRAKHFAEELLCSPFITPPGGISLGTSNSLDLARREGCDYCHTTLEPMASAWGRWPEFAAGYLDPVSYPNYSAECYACSVANRCGKTSVCALSYVTSLISNEQLPYRGSLLATQFLQREDEANLLRGPRQLVADGLADGRIASCAAQKAAENLLGRSMSSRDDEGWVADLGFDFAADGWNYKHLVKALVTSDEYRRPR